MIFWAKTKRGRQMPVNAEPDENGNLVVDGPIIRQAIEGDHGQPLYKSHFATCSAADAFRKK